MTAAAYKSTLAGIVSALTGKRMTECPHCNGSGLYSPKRAIVTHHECPPIPDRRFDWMAHYEGMEEYGCYGYGATEAEAIADFKANYAEEDGCPECDATGLVEEREPDINPARERAADAADYAYRMGRE
jgi:hypothetical protein